MTSFTWIHWLVTIGVGTISTVLFILSFRLKGQVLLVSWLILFLLTTLVLSMGYISLDKKTKKATLTKVHNKRILRTEEISFQGYVVNSGNYKIGTSELEIKLINHGKAMGHVKGSDFYRTNSIFGDLFTSKSDRKKARPGTVDYKFVLAKDLLPGERRKFMVRFKFPSYFRDVSFRLKLHNDLAEQTVRSQ